MDRNCYVPSPEISESEAIWSNVNTITFPLNDTVSDVHDNISCQSLIVNLIFHRSSRKYHLKEKTQKKQMGKCTHKSQSLEFNRIINRTSKVNKNKNYPQKVKKLPRKYVQKCDRPFIKRQAVNSTRLPHQPTHR